MAALLSFVLFLLQAHAYDGRWVADIAASRFNGAVAVRSVALEVAITATSVSLTNRIVDTSGKEIVQGSTFVTDGTPHPNSDLMPGLIVVARWLSPRLLDTVLTRPDGVVDHVTYEWSEDGRTLIGKTSGPFGTQEIVMRRIL